MKAVRRTALTTGLVTLLVLAGLPGAAHAQEPADFDASAAAEGSVDSESIELDEDTSATAEVDEPATAEVDDPDDSEGPPVRRAASADASAEAALGEPKEADETTVVGVPVKSRWELTIDGYAALNILRDTTQSYPFEGAHNLLIARPGTYQGHHPRMQMSARDSRIGLNVRAPEAAGIRASGRLELDFAGVQSPHAIETEAFTMGAMRMRHAFLKLETSVVDVLAGQFHDLFGWGGHGFYPATIAFLGVGGQVFHRQPQLRVSRTQELGPVEVELGVAATRPVQRDSGYPDVQAGLRIATDSWTGASAQAYGQPEIRPVSVGISAIGRRFEVAEYLPRPYEAETANGFGIAANALLPILPATSVDDRGNALTVTAEYSVGTGIADMYTGLTGGVLFPALPNPGSQSPAPLYPANIEPGIVTYDGDGNLRTVDWDAFVVGGQYYLPVAGGRIWVAAIYSRLQSGNIAAITPPANDGAVIKSQEYVDGSLFFQLTPATQVGLGYQITKQTYVDGLQARNERLALGMHLFF